MEHVLTSAEMKASDKAAIEEYGIGSMVLMERAALQTVRVILDRYGTDLYVGVMAGNGNNGGDGLPSRESCRSGEYVLRSIWSGSRQSCRLRLLPSWRLPEN